MSAEELPFGVVVTPFRKNYLGFTQSFTGLTTPIFLSIQNNQEPKITNHSVHNGVISTNVKKHTNVNTISYRWFTNHKSTCLNDFIITL